MKPVSSYTIAALLGTSLIVGCGGNSKKSKDVAEDGTQVFNTQVQFTGDLAWTRLAEVHASKFWASATQGDSADFLDYDKRFTIKSGAVIKSCKGGCTGSATALALFQIPQDAGNFRFNADPLPGRSCTFSPDSVPAADIADADAGEEGTTTTITSTCTSAPFAVTGEVSGNKGEVTISAAGNDDQVIAPSTAETPTKFELTLDQEKFVDAGIKAENYEAYNVEDAEPNLKKITKAFADLFTEATATYGAAYSSTNVGYHRRGDGSRDLQIKATDVTATSSDDSETCTVVNGLLEIRTAYHTGPYSGSGISWNETKILGDEAVVKVTCAEKTVDPGEPTEYKLSVAVTGLTSGTLTLRNQINLNKLVVTADGTHEFTTKIKENDGYDYDVRVIGQPAGLTCTLSNDVGTATADVTVTATCGEPPAPTYTVGGVANDIPLGEVIDLQITYGVASTMDDLTVSFDPFDTSVPFTFGAALSDGDEYTVSVMGQPDGYTCAVDEGQSGTISGANNDDVEINCVEDEP